MIRWARGVVWRTLLLGRWAWVFSYGLAWHLRLERLMPKRKWIRRHLPKRYRNYENIRSGTDAIRRHARSGGTLAELWPKVKPLEERHIKNCRVVTDRYAMLELMPKGGACAELGIAAGDYSARILEAVKPQELHLFDIYPAVIGNARARFAAEVDAGRVVLHEGDSSTNVSALGDVRFDWAYIDGAHSYGGVRRDLAALRTKMKPGGLIALNDYTFISPLDLYKYGVIEAVNEFCHEHDYEMIYMALHDRGYNDVVLRAMGAGEMTGAEAL